MSGGFFDQLERQLIEVARVPARDAALQSSRARARIGKVPRRLIATTIPAVAVTLAVAALAAVAIVTTIDSGPPPARHTLGERGGRASGGSSVEAATPRGSAVASGSSSATASPFALQGLSDHRLRKLTGFDRAAVDAAWEGSACGGCYLADEAALRGGVRGSATWGRTIALHASGGNLRRLCLWLLASDGGPAAGSTCSTEALLAVSAAHSPKDAALIQGFGSGDGEIALAGGT